MPLPRFSDVLAADAAVLIDQLGELVEFRPANGTPREIYAIIKREPIAATGGNQSRARPSILATFVTSEPAGINPGTLDFKGSKLRVAYLASGAVEDYGFTREILLQTPGRWKVRLR